MNKSIFLFKNGKKKYTIYNETPRALKLYNNTVKIATHTYF